eukprot:g2486.t1
MPRSVHHMMVSSLVEVRLEKDEIEVGEFSPLECRLRYQSGQKLPNGDHRGPRLILALRDSTPKAALGSLKAQDKARAFEGLTLSAKYCSAAHIQISTEKKILTVMCLSTIHVRVDNERFLGHHNFFCTSPRCKYYFIQHVQK